LARLAGVNVETVRFYERQGLIPEPPRGLGECRRYELGTISLLVFIRRVKALGFSLEEIRDLLTLRCETKCNKQEHERFLSLTLLKIEKRLAHLRALHAAVQRIKLHKDSTDCSFSLSVLFEFELCK